MTGYPKPRPDAAKTFHIVMDQPTVTSPQHSEREPTQLDRCLLTGDESTAQRPEQGRPSAPGRNALVPDDEFFTRSTPMPPPIAISYCALISA